MHSFTAFHYFQSSIKNNILKISDYFTSPPPQPQPFYDPFPGASGDLVPEENFWNI